MSEINTEIRIGENGNWYINGVDTGNPSRGESAYDSAFRNGYRGTEKEWVDSLKGKDGRSAYEMAVALDYKGTMADWTNNLRIVAGQMPYIGENGHWFIGEEDTSILADAERAVQNNLPLRQSITGITTKYGNLELGIDPELYDVISISSFTGGLMCIPYINTMKTQWTAHVRSSGLFSAYAEHELTVEVVYIRR